MPEAYLRPLYTLGAMCLRNEAEEQVHICHSTTTGSLFDGGYYIATYCAPDAA